MNAGPRASRGKFGLGYGLSPKVIVDPHLLTAGTRAGVWSQHTTRRDCRSRNRLGGHPSRQSFGTTRRIPALEGGSHLGSSLNPRGAVLTGGVSRRSGSVTYVRADASPNEVLAKKYFCTMAREKSTRMFDNRQSLTNSLRDCPSRYCAQTGIVGYGDAATSASEKRKLLMMSPQRATRIRGR